MGPKSLFTRGPGIRTQPVAVYVLASIWVLVSIPKNWGRGDQ
jgi:hypothetical protein